VEQGRRGSARRERGDEDAWARCARRSEERAEIWRRLGRIVNGAAAAARYHTPESRCGEASAKMHGCSHSLSLSLSLSLIVILMLTLSQSQSQTQSQIRLFAPSRSRPRLPRPLLRHFAAQQRTGIGTTQVV
jgi:hypothetical protein